MSGRDITADDVAQKWDETLAAAPPRVEVHNAGPAELTAPRPNEVTGPPAAPARRATLFDLQAASLDEALRFAEKVATSGMVPNDYRDNPGGILVAWQMGGEIGLSPMQALQNIANINGRPAIWGDAVIGSVLASGLMTDIDDSWDPDEDGGTYTVSVVRRGMKRPTTRTFSVGDARKANLFGKKSAWSGGYWRRMCFNRARAWALRDAFADVLKGLHLREEIEDYVEAEGVSAYAAQPKESGGSGSPPSDEAPKQEPAGPYVGPSLAGARCSTDGHEELEVPEGEGWQTSTGAVYCAECHLKARARQYGFPEDAGIVRPGLCLGCRKWAVGLLEDGSGACHACGVEVGEIVDAEIVDDGELDGIDPGTTGDHAAQEAADQEVLDRSGLRDSRDPNPGEATKSAPPEPSLPLEPAPAPEADSRASEPASGAERLQAISKMRGPLPLEARPLRIAGPCGVCGQHVHVEDGVQDRDPESGEIRRWHRSECAPQALLDAVEAS